MCDECIFCGLPYNNRSICKTCYMNHTNDTLRFSQSIGLSKRLFTNGQVTTICLNDCLVLHTLFKTFTFLQKFYPHNWVEADYMSIIRHIAVMVVNYVWWLFAKSIYDTIHWFQKKEKFANFIEFGLKV